MLRCDASHLHTPRSLSFGVERRGGRGEETVPRYGEVMVEMWFGRARDDGTVSKQIVRGGGRQSSVMDQRSGRLSQSIRSDEGELLTKRGREEEEERKRKRGRPLLRRRCTSLVQSHVQVWLGRAVPYISFLLIAHRPGRREVFPFGIIWGRR